MIVGLVLMATLCLWGMVRGLAVRSNFDPIAGTYYVSRMVGDPMWPGWRTYAMSAFRFIASFQGGYQALYRTDMTATSLFAAVMFLPQMLFAVAIGGIALFCAWFLELLARLIPSRAISARRMRRPGAISKG
jgi:hypothetical protein